MRWRGPEMRGGLRPFGEQVSAAMTLALPRSDSLFALPAIGGIADDRWIVFGTLPLFSVGLWLARSAASSCCLLLPRWKGASL